MKYMDSSKKVISLSQSIADRAGGVSQDKNRKAKTRVISMTSGKGGVGKTNIVANLGYALSRLGKQVLILDADLGLGNLDILLGLTPKYNFSHVISGEKKMQEITVKGPGDVMILPASSGIQELAHLTKKQALKIFTELDSLLLGFDLLLIDTAAGISSNVMHFNSIAQEIMVVVTPEPTSMTDSYALIKVLSKKYSVNEFKLLINMALNIQEAHDVFRQLKLVVDKFLDVSIECIGYISFDENVSKGVKFQKVVSERYPDTPASRCFESLAKKICMLPANKMPEEDTNFFWKDLLRI